MKLSTMKIILWGTVMYIYGRKIMVVHSNINLQPRPDHAIPEGKVMQKCCKINFHPSEISPNPKTTTGNTGRE